MSFTAWQDLLREAMPKIVANADNHKHEAAIIFNPLSADRHGWRYVGVAGALTRQRDASPLANFQAAAQYFLDATEETSPLTP
jgi:hypothetical protein